VEGFADDAKIGDDEYVLRAVSPKNVNWATSDTDGKPSISSNFFQDYPDDAARQRGLPGPCASVALERVLIEGGHELTAMLEEFSPKHGIVRVRVGDLRSLKNSVGDPCPQGVMADPKSGSPWHAVIWTARGGKRSSGEQRAISKIACWVKLPDP
jgi:hypothetical protein